MTRTQWWLGVSVLAAAILLHALVPRYEIRQTEGDIHAFYRVDRWTGSVDVATGPRVWLSSTATR